MSKTQKPKTTPAGSVTVKSKQRVTFAYTEYVAEGENLKVIIQAADDAFTVGQVIALK